MDFPSPIRITFRQEVTPANDDTGDWMALPATKERLQQELARTDTDNRMADRIQPTDIAAAYSWLSDAITDEADTNELNYLAAKISELDGEGLDKLEAVIESGRHRSNNGTNHGEIADLINIVLNLDYFTFHRDFDAQNYGEYLLTGHGNVVDRMLRQLQFSSRPEDEAFVQYVEAMRESVDAEVFGKSMSESNDGEFLDIGYLIEEGGYHELYYSTDDIPNEHRIWEPAETFIKVADVDLRGLLMEMHALGGNYTQDAADNLQTLVGGNEFFITENRGKLTILTAPEVFRNNSPENRDFMIAYEPDARAFFAALNEPGGSEFWGGLHEIDIKEIKSEVSGLCYRAVNIDVEFKDGTNRLFTPAEWYELSDWQRERAAGMVFRYDPADENRAAEFISGLRENAAKNGREVTQEDFLAVLNAPFMAKAQNAQPAMLRVARETARDMLARSDAEIYRLMPDGAVKLTPLDAVKSGGLWFKEHREFAIKLGGLAGLRKWANRTADEIGRQAMRGEQKKSRDNEL